MSTKTNTQENSDIIKNRVKERYSALAEQHGGSASPTALIPIAVESDDANCGTSGCCSPSSTSTGLSEKFYDADTLANLPETATNVSLGCGNPTALSTLSPGEVVLDLGSGGGLDCFIAARSVGPTGHVIGVDMTDQMLALANKNKAKQGIENVEFRKGDIEDLPVEANSVDVIISNCVINLSPDKDAVFAEAFRVLKPGGRLTVSDIVSEGHIPPALRENINAWAGCISGALDQADYLNKLRTAGFADVEVVSRDSYGIEDVNSLDEESQRALKDGVDWETVPDDARLYSANIIAYKPA